MAPSVQVGLTIGGVTYERDSFDMPLLLLFASFGNILAWVNFVGLLRCFEARPRYTSCFVVVVVRDLPFLLFSLSGSKLAWVVLAQCWP